MLASLRNLSEGSEESIVLSLRKQGEQFHHLLDSFLVFAFSVCFVATRLVSRRCQRKVGRLFNGLELATAAFLASLSALSLPIAFMCPATHVKEVDGELVKDGALPHWGLVHCDLPHQVLH